MKSNKIFIVMLFGVLITACSEIPQIGIIKNTSNNITTTFRNIKTGDVVKVMNGEIFEHNQVPLGQDFEIINKNISGFTVVDDMVNVGGELLVKDKSGEVLLHMPDMFAQNSVFHKDSITFLRSTVSTGRPMDYDIFYDVEIRYWDKYGDGELRNQLEIEIIDIP